MADDRLSTILPALSPSMTYFSLEFFPPKTQAGFSNLQSRLTRMSAALRPLFVSVTWGAGGSTSSKSLELAEVCQRQLGLTTVLHLTCTNMRKEMVDEALEACKELGVRNILALRGDPPRKEEYRDEESEEAKHNGVKVDDADTEEFTWAIDLVRYIRQKYDDYFCIGVAGYPEGHADESTPEIGKQSVENDVPYLAEKLKAGADFIMTQLTFDLDAYARYEKKLRDYTDSEGKKTFERIPIIPGLMPIQSYQTIKRITKLSHARLPKDISNRIEEVKADDDAVKRLGVDILSELVESIKKLPQPEGMPRGLHFYTLNLEKSVAFILERCNLIPPVLENTPSESSDSDAIIDENGSALNGNQAPPPARFSKRRASSMNAQPHNRVIIISPSKTSGQERKERAESIAKDQKIVHEAPVRGAGIPASVPNRQQGLLISEGQGSLGREATWDDFPNGRWGPSHSPAFGEIDGYGPSLKVGPVSARRLWGNPKSASDITELFRRHVDGDLEAVPWSDEVDVDGLSTGSAPGALRAETDVIRKDLLALIQKKNYWTLASQPAVDGVRSNHPVFGWGPPGEGFVFQKAFVEFFCPRRVWEQSLRPRLVKAGPEEVSWMKSDAQGLYESSETILNQDGPVTNGSSDQPLTNGHTKIGLEELSRRKSASSKAVKNNNSINAVTWGVFRGKEIITPTIIESESFRAWSEEAYNVWGEWRRCFPRGSDEEKCLEEIRRDVVLVNLVGHAFVGGHQGEGGGLWRLLLE